MSQRQRYGIYEARGSGWQRRWAFAHASGVTDGTWLMVMLGNPVVPSLDRYRSLLLADAVVALSHSNCGRPSGTFAKRAAVVILPVLPRW